MKKKSNKKKIENVKQWLDADRIKRLYMFRKKETIKNLYREVYKEDPPKSKAAYRIVDEMLDIFRDEADDEPGDEYDGYSEKYYLNRSNLT